MYFPFRQLQYRFVSTDFISITQLITRGLYTITTYHSTQCWAVLLHIQVSAGDEPRMAGAEMSCMAGVEMSCMAGAEMSCMPRAEVSHMAGDGDVLYGRR